MYVCDIHVHVRTSQLLSVRKYRITLSKTHYNIPTQELTPPPPSLSLGYNYLRVLILANFSEFEKIQLLNFEPANNSISSM